VNDLDQDEGTERVRHAYGENYQPQVRSEELLPLEPEHPVGGRREGNAGSNTNMKPGTSLEAYTKGEELKDPATGLSLGSRDKLIGTVTITQIEEKFSVGTFEGARAL
jgi:hypothetical protein